MTSPERLADIIKDHREILLMCDYDGTLVPLAPRPELALPDACLLDSLQQLARRPDIHLAVISGRSLDELRQLLPVPGLFLAGLHGSRISGPDGNVIDLLPVPGDVPWEQILARARQALAGLQGVFIEDKGEALALHYRLAEPQTASRAIIKFRRYLKPFLIYDLEFLVGDKVLELRRRGRNKGLAVKYFTAQWPAALPLYLGDDRTDVDAFTALPAGGLAVGVGPRFYGRAPCSLASPVEVNRFLTYVAKQ